MYILTDKQNVIQHITETLNRQPGTNYYLINNDSLAIPTEFIKEVYNIDNIPENIEEQKYCYTTKKGFYKNENYIEPLQPIEEQITDIQIALAELGELISGGVK